MQQLIQQLSEHQPRKILWRQRMTRAAVAIVLSDRFPTIETSFSTSIGNTGNTDDIADNTDEIGTSEAKAATTTNTTSSSSTLITQPTKAPCILMIRRAEHPLDPWSGHMAFPGGRMERIDRRILTTAIRETTEEIGLSLHEEECVGRLSDVVTRRHDKIRPMVVTPWMFTVDAADPRLQNLAINYEVSEAVWIPLSFFADDDNRQVMTWRKFGITMRLPCYFYEGRRVWGLSLMMIRELTRIYGLAGDGLVDEDLADEAS